MLDPRRPLVPTSEHREEGLIPYLPELGIPHQSMVNYNQSVSIPLEIYDTGCPKKCKPIPNFNVD